ncbi:hypothetical protein PENARI_c030G03835 [Penicillium arizonense]|uniref:OTU domain-containing protein n=1 Tax=Penicillium arizonense TaxID=1835702 RepID=A0A1F5L4Z8_PENAI|nr:hypothetical protein PENARI_c030G03835 [Penicillium arizonense]OGE48285.1 hypothetical protein PENARI_c030G03835 [Penicillium arizonense]
MSHLTHGGRIVPILTGHEHQVQEELPQTADPLQDQQAELLAKTQQNNSTMDHASLEMPCLKERGLFALPTEGDGNCLYYSLSDQLYGITHHADEIRQRLATHMANNKKYFMQFVVAEGGERRRPKRAAVSAYATRSADILTPSLEDKERRFEDMIATTRKNGEWASSEHLQAFCQVFQVDLNVYTMDGVQVFRDVNALPDQPRDVLHVAFHDFKHYSSVRRINGQHKGLLSGVNIIPQLSEDIKPDVDRKLAEDCKDIPVIAGNTPSGPDTTDTDLAVDLYPPWDIKSIQECFGGRYDRETIVDMLQKCRGDIDRAFAALLDENTDVPFDKKAAPGLPIKQSLQASRSSSPFSTGSKRSAEDSDDSEDPRPARRTRPKRRIVSNLTLGVGISFRDDQNELVSLNLRMESETENGQNTDPLSLPGNTTPEQSDSDGKANPRRSGRISSRPL